MSAYSVARLAEADMRAIIRFTNKTWGRTQTFKYTQDLHAGFQLLADNPSIGRVCNFQATGLRRFERGKHVIFYVPLTDGILIVRVLHQQMVPERSRFDQQ
jgi:toxin ParE1/3/4